MANKNKSKSTLIQCLDGTSNSLKEISKSLIPVLKTLHETQQIDNDETTHKSGEIKSLFEKSEILAMLGLSINSLRFILLRLNGGKTNSNTDTDLNLRNELG